MFVRPPQVGAEIEFGPRKASFEEPRAAFRVSSKNEPAKDIIYVAKTRVPKLATLVYRIEEKGKIGNGFAVPLKKENRGTPPILRNGELYSDGTNSLPSFFPEKRAFLFSAFFGERRFGEFPIF